MSSYNDYIAKLADAYNTGCKPEITGCNEDKVPEYNCEDCNYRDCYHWAVYNVI